MRDMKFHNCIILTIIMPAWHDAATRNSRYLSEMQLSDQSQRMKQNQLALVRRFNRDGRR